MLFLGASYMWQFKLQVWLLNHASRIWKVEMCICKLVYIYVMFPSQKVLLEKLDLDAEHCRKDLYLDIFVQLYMGASKRSWKTVELNWFVCKFFWVCL